MASRDSRLGSMQLCGYVLYYSYMAVSDLPNGTVNRQRGPGQLANVVNKHAGGQPKASADQMGVQPDETRLQCEEQR
jgi:hypothetical protein